MEQPLFPVPVQIRTKTFPEMAHKGHAQQDAQNDGSLMKAGTGEHIPVAGDGTVNNPPAAQRKEDGQQGIAHLSHHHQYNNRYSAAIAGKQPGNGGFFHFSSLRSHRFTLRRALRMG